MRAVSIYLLKTVLKSLQMATGEQDHFKTACEDDDDDDDVDWDEEEEMMSAPARCLFCRSVFCGLIVFLLRSGNFLW